MTLVNEYAGIEMTKKSGENLGKKIMNFVLVKVIQIGMIFNFA